MFAVDEVTVAAPFDRAAARLIHLINGEQLGSASKAAYHGGLERIARVGPFGNVPGLSKLVLVRALKPARQGTSMTVAVRWEATGVAGELFPVLDGDLILTADSDDRSRLRLIGSYRPPFGRAGAALDRAVMGRVAGATIRSFLEGTAVVLGDPAPDQQPAVDAASPRPRPVIEPAGS